MRRALQLLNSVNRHIARRRIRSPLSISSQGFHHAPITGIRTFSSRRGSVFIDQSSMQLRSLSVAVAAAAVAGGTIYWRGGQSPLRADSPRGTASLSDNSPLASSAISKEQAQTTRRALIVEQQGQIYSGEIVGDRPLEKKQDGSGRNILEMLTPEQATQVLRRNQESWIVNRGEGVVRYDLVQIASNNPIEDDHVEKIIQVPDTVAATGTEKKNTDWMFWGVFDGHRLVLLRRRLDEVSQM